MKAKNEIFMMILVPLFTLSFITGYAQEKKWEVPESSANIKNPVKNTAENVNIGKSLYVKHCKSCHGKSGEGDGTKAAELDTAPGDFSSAEFQSQTDGALYYKTAEGRDDMPSFKKKIDSSEDIWAIVHYLRTFKK